MRQFNIDIDKTSPKTSQFTVPANEHFSILVSYKNWEDKQQWLDYTLADDSGADIVKEKIEMQNGSVLYFCSHMGTSTKLHFKSSTSSQTYIPSDIMQIVVVKSSTQDNCFICAADVAGKVPWSGVQNKPTTVSGYGMTDAATIEYVDSQIGNVLTQEEF